MLGAASALIDRVERSKTGDKAKWWRDLARNCLLFSFSIIFFSAIVGMYAQMLGLAQHNAEVESERQQLHDQYMQLQNQNNALQQQRDKLKGMASDEKTALANSSTTLGKATTTLQGVRTIVNLGLRQADQTAALQKSTSQAARDLSDESKRLLATATRTTQLIRSAAIDLSLKAPIPRDFQPGLETFVKSLPPCDFRSPEIRNCRSPQDSRRALFYGDFSTIPYIRTTYDTPISPIIGQFLDIHVSISISSDEPRQPNSPNFMTSMEEFMPPSDIAFNAYVTDLPFSLLYDGTDETIKLSTKPYDASIRRSGDRVLSITDLPGKWISIEFTHEDLGADGAPLIPDFVNLQIDGRSFQMRGSCFHLIGMPSIWKWVWRLPRTRENLDGILAKQWPRFISGGNMGTRSAPCPS